jgi:hypothetical protein
MAEVQTFTQAMIESYLREKEWNYLTDRKGNFQMNFSADEATGYAWTVFFSAMGERNDIYQVFVRANHDFPQSQWPEIVDLCNDWNSRRFYPTAYLLKKDLESANPIGTVVLEHSIDLEKGIHQELLNDFTSCAYFGAINFWKWAHGEKGL